MRYRLLIFDFDGTLADSFPAFLGHVHQTIEHFGLRSVDASDLDELRSMGAREIMAYLGIPAWKAPLVARYMRRLIAFDASQTQLFPGVVELLRNLTEQGCVVAIVSSNSEANIRAILGPENTSLIHAFDCGASLFGKASRFRRVLKRTGLAASQALAIGDELRDLDAAREAGIDFGAVSWGYTKVEALQRSAPACVFHRPADIQELMVVPTGS